MLILEEWDFDLSPINMESEKTQVTAVVGNVNAPEFQEQLPEEEAVERYDTLSLDQNIL